MLVTIGFGFIPPGHRAIMAILVLHAWPHESGAWLSIQAIGRSMALVWRSSDSWKATAMLVYEVDDHPTRKENFNEAVRIGELLLAEGPPSALMASANKSAQVRKEKASAAARQRWKNNADKSASGKRAQANLEKGPDVNSVVWEWKRAPLEGAAPEGCWGLFERENTDNHFYCDNVCKDKWKLTREWWDEEDRDEVVIAAGPLEKCFATIEAMARRGSDSWKLGDGPM
jgi:hypothetical protein